MPNIGFFELLLIGVVALLVLGPEKLPGAIRTTSLWVGRARRSFNKVKSDIERELNADEIRRQLHNESILADIDEAKKKARALAEETRKDLDRLGQEVDDSVKDLGSLKERASSNPALLDEAPQDTPAPETGSGVSSEGSTGTVNPVAAPASNPAADAEAPSSSDTPRKTPPQDFYNNPGVGVIELRDGKFQPAQTTPADDDGKAGAQ